MAHDFGPWDESPAAHKKDFRVFAEKFDENEGSLQVQCVGRRLRRLNTGMSAKEDCVCEHEQYGGLYNDANLRTVRIKYLNRAFSDDLNG